MYPNVKASNQTLRTAEVVSNDQVNKPKTRFIDTIRLVVICALFLALIAALFLTYRLDNDFFWPLLEVSIIVALVTFISIISNSNKFLKI